MTAASPGGGSMLPRIVGPAGEVVISVRPVGVSAGGPGGGIEQLQAELRGRWRQAARAVMVLLSLRGLPPSRIAELPGCHPAAVRRWIGRFSGGGDPGAGRPAAVRAVPAGRAPAGRAGRRAAGPAGPVDAAADPPFPGLAAGQRAGAVPAGPAGGGLAAARADRPRRPGPRPRGGRDRGPAGRAAAPGGGAGRGRGPPEPAAACAGQLDAARRPARGAHSGHEPQGHRARRDRGDDRDLGVPAGPPLRGGLHRPAGPGAAGVPRRPRRSS